jgi:hypothetical protein
MTRSTGWLALCLTCLFVGCGGGGSETGPTGEVEGTVTVAGEPLTEGSVAFYQAETGGSGGGALGPGGKFKFDIPVPVGIYQVSFRPPEAPQPDDEASGKLANVESDIHEGYQNGETSEIYATIKEGPNTFTFDLTKQGPAGGAGGEAAP